jgi:glycosyltransferase involved in cell wall biosynthesis
MKNGCVNVAWDNSLAKRNPTGTGVYAAHLVRELAALPEVKLTVFAGWDPANRQPGQFGGQGILARGARAVRSLAWSHGYFPHLLRKGGFDLLHSPAFVVPLRCPCPSVATIFDVSFLMFPEHYEWRWRQYLKHVMPSVLRRVSAVICISEHSRQDLLRFYDVPPGKVHVVYCGIDHERFSPAAILDPNWARSVGLTREYLLHVGTVSERKNIPMLLRALASLRSRGNLENLQLCLAGPELSVLTGASDIHRLVQELGLGETVVFTGQVPEEHLPGLYARARLVVMPSLYEGFGLPVLEGMASGAPVVASNASSLPEIAGDAALLAPPQDEAAWAEAIQSILENPMTAAELRRKGLQRARQFSWQRAASETLAVYRGIAG